jgi:tetratricopeptide (TPR) repeat protein
MMKYRIFGCVFLLAASLGLFGQQSVSVPQKFALVIGNGAYASVTRLANPANDANDMKAALEGLGFRVELVIDGTLVQMEEGVTRLKNRLSGAADAYGFFFYAGHGVQSAGETYLIPVAAALQSEAYLRTRALSVQAVLDELQQAGNALNMVVLDACRDNPFGWKRSGSRGLSVVGYQPPGSIIMYATSAGQAADDGTGRNGLFTGQLLKNLKTPGLSVRDIFDRTGADVCRASENRQIPAIYSQFFETAHLDVPPARPSSGETDYLLHYNRACDYYFKGGYDQALVEFTGALRFNPASADAYAGRGNVYNSVGEYGRGASEYEQAVRFNAGYGPYSRGIAAYINQDYDRAIAECSESIRIMPGYVFAYTCRANSYNEKGDNDRAIADLSEAIRIKPQYAIALRNRGLRYYDKRDYNRAIADYTEAIRINPGFTAAFGSRGQAYRSKGDYDSALADLAEAVRLDPRYTWAYIIRGNLYKDNQGDYDRAIADYTEVIRLDPKNTAAYQGRGDAYRMKGDYDKAIRDSTEALRIDARYQWAYGTRGAAYRAKGNYEEALADFTEAVRLDPKYVWAYNSRANLYKENKKDYDRAIADYTEVIRLDPKNTAAYQGRGDAYRMKGDYDGAIRDSTEALRIDARYQLAYGTRGAAYRARGSYDKAIADFTEAIRIDPRYIFAYEERAKVYDQKGDRSKADADRAEAARLRGR